VYHLQIFLTLHSHDTTVHLMKSESKSPCQDIQRNATKFDARYRWWFVYVSHCKHFIASSRGGTKN